MYTIELNNLQREDLQRESLKMIEHICEEFDLQNDFGTLSLSIHEFIDQLLLFSLEKETETSIHFLLSKKEMDIRIQHSENVSAVKHIIETKKSDSNSVYTMLHLADNIKFDDDQTVTLSFHVKPDFLHLQKGKANLSEGSEIGKGVVVKRPNKI